MQKFFAVLLCLGLVCGLSMGVVGCNKEKEKDKATKDKEVKADKEKEVKTDKEKEVKVDKEKEVKTDKDKK